MLVFIDRNVVVGDAEMHGAGAGDGDLGRHPGIGGHELEMLEHGVIGGKAEPVGDHRHVLLCMDAMELDATAFALDDVEAVEHAHEIEMPPGAPEFAVGHRLEARIFLHLDDVADGFVLDGLELFGAQGLVLEAGLAGLFDAVGAQKRANDIGVIGRLGNGHEWSSSIPGWGGVLAVRPKFGNRLLAFCIQSVFIVSNLGGGTRQWASPHFR